MSKNKITKRTLYILTEGQTEQAYFSRISEILGDEDDWKYSITVEVREIEDGSKTDPLNMVYEAKKSQKDYDEIWVVFDKDRERDEQNLKAVEAATRSKIKVAFSSISFEEWVLLHFEKSKYAFIRSDCESRGEICVCKGTLCLSTYLKQRFFPKYQKGRAKLYNELQDKLTVALENAAWLRHQYAAETNYLVQNPYTDVDKLVLLLLELPSVIYADKHLPFIFKNIEIRFENYSIFQNTVTISIIVTNNSGRAIVFNNLQKNIKLLGSDNTEFDYSIENAQYINPGEQKSLDLQYLNEEPIEPKCLKFISDDENLFVEIQ